MIRITGGQYKGRQIASPKNKDIRPTSGRVRESVFGKLSKDVQGARFLDLFAGSGVMGLEALSRGAVFAMAVEKHPDHARLIRENYRALEIPAQSHKVLNLNAEHLMAKPADPNLPPFDLIFLDPPYGHQHLDQLVQQIQLHHWVSPQGLIMIEHGSHDPRLAQAEYKDYGDTLIAFITP